MKTTILILALTTLMGSFLFGQSVGSIKGKIVEKSNGLPIPSAHVYILSAGQKIGTASELDGTFHLKTLQPGTYDLYVVSLGFKKYLLTSINVLPGRPAFINDIKMEEESYIIGDGNGVIVTAQNVRKLIDPGDPTMQNLGPGEIENIAGAGNINDIVKTISPEVQVPSNGAGIIVRGARSGSTQYMLDGVKMENMGSVASYSINSVSVYTGGIPSQYGDLTGGIIIIETKSYFDFLSQYQAKARRKEEAKQSL